MTDVKRLLAEATPLPWSIAHGGFGGLPIWVQADTVMYEDGSGPRIVHLPPNGGEPDAALIVYAVNRLSDYEAAVEALERLEQAIADGYYLLSDAAVKELSRSPQRTPVAIARAALARLRESDGPHDP